METEDEDQDEYSETELLLHGGVWIDVETQLAVEFRFFIERVATIRMAHFAPKLILGLVMAMFLNVTTLLLWRRLANEELDRIDMWGADKWLEFRKTTKPRRRRAFLAARRSLRELFSSDPPCNPI